VDPQVLVRLSSPKKLAMKSGLEYAVMVGSDIAPLGPAAVDELNKLFDWAEK
jgi:ATPase family AAA domain-containing protein 3A/B